MNFDDAFKHYQEGCATDEEKAYVKQQLQLANDFFEDDAKHDSVPCKEAGREEVKKAKKKFKWRYVIIPVCSIVLSLIIIASILGGVFGYAASCAKKSAFYGRQACAEIARDKAFDFMTNDSLPYDFAISNRQDLTLHDVDAHFNYNGRRLEDSYYTYFVEFEYFDFEIELEVDTRNGDCRVVKVDR